VSVDQTQHKNSWTQLTLNGDATTQWNFVKAKGYVTAVASNLSTTQMLNLSALVRFEAILSIGQTYQGGIVFYLDGTNQHGLIAAPIDQGTDLGVQWWNDSNIVTGAVDTAVGTGKSNTAAIIAKQATGVYAAKLCDDLVLRGYSDWYLPSKDELNLMYTNIGRGAVAPLTNIGGFVGDHYWSSSTYSDDIIWNQDFFYGYQANNHQIALSRVRAIRSF
jgi:hypothetical protein